MPYKPGGERPAVASRGHSGEAPSLPCPLAVSVRAEAYLETLKAAVREDPTVLQKTGYAGRTRQELLDYTQAKPPAGQVRFV